MPVTRVAACHAAPFFLDARKTVDKALRLIKEASSHEAKLVAFPETFIPGFPLWSALRSPAENHGLFERMAKNSVAVDGDEMRAIQSAAKDHRIVVSIGLSERERHSTATLYNSNVIYGADGKLLVHHRKLVPTFFEKLTWAPGDGAGLQVADTPFGRIGQLICGENTNPLARYALMSESEQIHISSWPPVWPTRHLDSKSPPSIKGKNYDNVAANRMRAAAHCFEAKCFGVMCASVLDADAIKATSEGAISSQLVNNTLEESPRGATMFIDPTGASLSGFTIDSTTGHKTVHDFLQIDEGILYADLELDDCIWNSASSLCVLVFPTSLSNNADR